MVFPKRRGEPEIKLLIPAHLVLIQAMFYILDVAQLIFHNW